MKKIIVLLLMAVFLLSGCSKIGENRSYYSDSIFPNPTKENPINDGVDCEYSVGAWLSYSEIEQMLKSENGFKEEFEILISKLKAFGVKELYVHVCAHCDAIYPSKIYPQTDGSKVGYDIFAYMCERLRQENILIHAWINPYRVSTETSDITTLDSNSPAYKWLTDKETSNDKNVSVYNGIYLDPGEAQVRHLITDLIKELITVYHVDGIHFDDYFYPTCDEAFDRDSYEAYTKRTTSPLKLEDFRRASVNALISESYRTVKSQNKNVIFSVSPAASLADNYSEKFADVATWIKKGYLDAVIPQLYFGFEHPDPEFCFENLLKKWQDICKNNKNVRLLIGLAAYKCGESSEWDGDEWEINCDILSRQSEILQNCEDVKGEVYFSCSSLFSENEANKKERENIQMIR